MAKKIERLTTGEFAKLTGVPAATITKLIRDGKLKAVKEAGKWMIAKSQSKLKVLKEYKKSPKKTTQKPTPPQKTTARSKSTVAKPRKAASGPRRSTPTEPKPSPKTAGGKTYTVPEFSSLTYLTDFGVTQWLKQGRLEGRLDDNGQWRVAASNFELPVIKRLLRR